MFDVSNSFAELMIALWNSECEDDELVFSYSSLPDELRFDVQRVNEYCDILGGKLGSRQIAAMIFHNYKKTQ